LKTEFLAVYDYETGGAWVYLLADSAAQIHERFPELRVVNDRPTCSPTRKTAPTGTDDDRHR
jgi:hypothetical protein